ncbi:MAG: glutathione synthase [Xanthomonadales bacterium]|nr:glutathione synthase [Xanthomonadales bacterium]
MNRHLAVLMDPIDRINIKKDTSFALLLEAQARGYRLSYLELPDLGAGTDGPTGRSRPLQVFDDPTRWFELGAAQERPLQDFDLILVRKDPPFDSEYLYATLLLDLVDHSRTQVVNRPQSLRDANEKLAALWFPQCLPPLRVSRRRKVLREFVMAHGQAVLKVLDGMGGRNIFLARADDPNLTVILDTVTAEGSRMAMVQRYLPEIAAGDKRILLIDGEPVDHCLARIPRGGDFRGNLAQGGGGEVRPLTERDRWICAQVGPECRRRGLRFVGLDVIGDYLTEVNVTSPTCLREIAAVTGQNIAGRLFDALEATAR